MRGVRCCADDSRRFAIAPLPSRRGLPSSSLKVNDPAESPEFSARESPSAAAAALSDLHGAFGVLEGLVAGEGSGNTAAAR